MTVLFSDIRGFTTMSEKGAPEAIVAQLNELFTRMVPIVFAHRGTVDKFVGDMIMALYGAPLDDPGSRRPRGADGAGDGQELARLNSEWARRGQAARSTSASASTPATWWPATSGPRRS